MSNAYPPVVGIGASAGGIDAFRRFFEKMPADSGFAFVVLLHLAAGRRSMLPQILSRWTTMKVAEAEDGDALMANHVLVIPAGVIAGLQDGCVSLRPLSEAAATAIAPIDAFFDSMATSLNEEAIGVVLSGTGHDGALGLKAIKARGGLTLAQGENGTAPEYSGMPNSAQATGAVDLLVPVEDMPSRILAARDIRRTTLQEEDRSTRDMAEIQSAICRILRSRLGHDFKQYKIQTFIRRVQRRMQVLRLTSYDEYIQRLEADRDQVVLLFRDLLISVTSFFRDSSTFAALERDIIPGLFQNKDAAGELRVWVPGCATGEEAYSLAILLREHMDKLSTTPRVHIFASDIDEVAIGTARAGRFPATLLGGMSAERRARFFTEANGTYVARQEIRELCTFSAHSLIRDPPFSRIDLISCRNLLIYMDNDLQDRVIPIFHYALVPGGLLVLGASETVVRHEQLFQPLDRQHRIFVRRDGPSDLPNVYQVAPHEVRSAAKAHMRDPSDPKAHWARAVTLANRRVLDRFSSPFVVVDAAGEIAHFSSHTGRFLEPAAGAPSTNLFEMARPGWSLELRAALRRCIEAGRPIEHQRAVAAADGAKSAAVKLLVEPLLGPDNDRLYMIVFVEAEQPHQSGDLSPSAMVPDWNAATAHLERENLDLREQLRAIAEEHATAVEELRSSNEELQSVNEELQSTNEELETSREEIQSINEELNTVNVQLTGKVEQLARSNGT